MTEDEAKTKWCPFVRRAFRFSAIDDLAVPVNRGAEGKIGGCQCIASACIAWRWEIEFSASGRAKVSDEGYCGLVSLQYTSNGAGE